MKPGLSLLMLGMAVSGAVTAFAADTASPTEDRLTLQGFGTLGIARSDNDEAQYVRDLSQPYGATRDWSAKIDSMLGLQAGYRLNNEVNGVLQAVSRYRYDGSWEPEITWAFLRYDPTPSASLRVGRLGTEFYMQADSRLVGYSNLTLRPPPDYFGTLIFSYFDGIDLGLSKPLGNGLLRGKLFAGVSPERSPFVANITWDLAGTLLAGGHIDYQDGPWQVRLGHTQVRFEHELPFDRLVPGIISAYPALSVVDKWTRFDSLGVVYDRGPLQLQLMLSRTEHDTAAYEDTRSGYAIASYRSNRFTPYLGYSKVKSDPIPASRAPPGITSATHSDQHTWFAGVRWDLKENLALKAQVDHIRGAPDSIFPFRYGPTASMPPWDGRMTVFSVALDFVF